MGDGFRQEALDPLLKLACEDVLFGLWEVLCLVGMVRKKISEEDEGTIIVSEEILDVEFVNIREHKMEACTTS